jgi:IS1 family transposase
VGKGGLHSCLRDRNARLRRRTKAYSKSITMLKCSIAISAKYGGRKEICF